MPSSGTGYRKRTTHGRVLSTLLAAVALAGALLAAACGGGDGGSAPANPAQPPVPNTVNPTVPSETVTGVVGKPATTVEIPFEATTSAGADLTVDVSALPAGWSVASGGTCTQVPSGVGCAMTLAYAPTSPSAGAQTLSLPYRYVDNLGNQRTGTVSLSYLGRMAYAYLARPSTPAGGSVWRCDVDTAGNLTGCMDSGATGLNAPYRMAFSGGIAYIVNAPAAGGGFLTRCVQAEDGSLTACENQSVGVARPVDIAIQDAQAYIADWQTGSVSLCQIVPDGSLVGCRAQATGVTQLAGMAFDGNWIFLVSEAGPALARCELDEDGALSACTGSGVATPATTTDVMVVGTQLFMPETTSPGLARCTVSISGAVGQCAILPVATAKPTTLDAFNGQAYIVDDSGSGASIVLRCQLDASGALGACTAASATGLEARSVRFD